MNNKYTIKFIGNKPYNINNLLPVLNGDGERR